MIPPIDVFKISKRLSEGYIQKNFPELWEEIDKIKKDISISEKLYIFYKKPIEDDNKCKVCGKPVKFVSIFKGYKKYCGKVCCAKDIDRINKSKQTKKERYGNEHYVNIEKIKETNLKKYGDVWNIRTQKVRDKMKHTKKERYGDENYNNVEKIKEHWNNITEKDREKITSKMKHTKKERYGDENYNNVEKIREHWNNITEEDREKITNKIKQTKKERYGDENYNNVEKQKQTCLERYGVEYAILSKEIKERNLESQKQSIINKYDLVDIEEDTGLWCCKCPHKDTCNKCEDKIYKINSTNYFARKAYNIEPCTNLLPIQKDKYSNTGIEIFIQDILNKHNIEYETNNRYIIPPKELDIYIPSKNIAIECNGMFWHSTDILHNKKYHYDKYFLCKEKGIQLINVWEDQIIHKKDIVESVILSKLGIYKNRIYARKCTIKEIDIKTSKVFINDNHIQGYSNSSIRLGLYYDNMLVSCMTFLIKSDKEYELNRFCSLKNTQIIGGAEKLLTYFIRNFHPKSIISYKSNDISDGNLYRKLGFLEDMKPSFSYWYVDKTTLKRYHRSLFCKSQLQKLGYDINNMTEDEIMKNSKYYKIYDCGHTCFRKKID